MVIHSHCQSQPDFTTNCSFPIFFMMLEKHHKFPGIKLPNPGHKLDWEKLPGFNLETLTHEVRVMKLGLFFLRIIFTSEKNNGTKNFQKYVF